MKRNSKHISPFDDFPLEYDAWFDEEGNRIFRIEVQAFKKLLSSLPKPWLETGVGSGRFAQALGVETGIDPSFKLLEIARIRGIHAFLARGEQQPFEEKSFGTVFVIVILCFLDSPVAVLNEVRRILKPHGKLVFGLVLKESQWGQFYQIKKANNHRFYRYASFYTYEETIGLIYRAGFAPERVISTLFHPPGEIRSHEDPREGYFSDAGFTIMVAGKKWH
jgi:SAM-dependent methyltransferase